MQPLSPEPDFSSGGEHIVPDFDVCTQPQSLWPLGVTIAAGLAVSGALFWLVCAEPELAHRCAWLMPAMGLVLTATFAFFLLGARRRVGQICKLIDSLAREIQDHRESEDSYRRLIESAPDAIITLDTDGLLTSTNPFYSALTGWAPGERLGKPFWPLVHPDDLRAALTAISSASKGGKPPVIEIRTLNKSGEFIPMEFILTPQSHDHRVKSIIAIGRDITSRRQSEHAQDALAIQLRRAQKMEAVGRLAGGIAHDFNNFLAVIIANAELARMEIGAAHTANESLDQIRKAGDRAADLVRQLMTCCHRQENERCVVKLQPIVKEAVKMLRAAIPADIRIQSQYEPYCPSVLADPGQIHQVLLNLGTNASHAISGKNGLMEISLTSIQVDSELAYRNPDLHTGNYLRLTVSDNGHGMNTTTLERIFEPFFTTKPPGKGTGLGLSVVHGIIKGHDGAISVYSEVNRGTTFHIYFPIVEAEAEMTEDHEVEIPRGSGERILLVDDEAALAKGSERVLNFLGYQTTVHTDPTVALELVRSQPDAFDCLITDFSMPSMSGLELAAETRNLQPSLPVILMTGYSGQLNLESLQPHGVHELLLKPFCSQLLAETLRRVLTQKDQKASENA